MPPPPVSAQSPDTGASGTKTSGNSLWLGQVGIGLTEKPMTVSIVRNPAQGCEPFCPQWIAAQGVITPETPKLLAAVLARLGSERVPVVFDSPGGDFDAALEMANLIRARGLDTIILTTAFIGCAPDRDCKPVSRSSFYKGFPMRLASCNGACVFAAIGGVTLISDDGRVLLHNPALYVSRASQRPVAVELMLHFAKMGVDKELLSRMLQIESGHALVLDAGEQKNLLHAITDESATANLLKPITCKATSPPSYCIKPAPGT